MDRHKKRTEKKKKQIINFVRNHPEATQREINRACKTKVQEIFPNGIYDAFKLAGVRYDFGRRKIHGAAYPNVRKSAIGLEKEVAYFLKKNFGKSNVYEQVKTKKGIIDILLTLNRHKIVIEIKNYRFKPISFSEIKQIKRYLKAVNATTGVILTAKRLNKNNKIHGIRVFETSELDEFLNFLRKI